jgi:hypothetical protein
MEEFKVNHENSETAQPVAELPAAVSCTRKLPVSRTYVPRVVQRDVVQKESY